MKLLRKIPAFTLTEMLVVLAISTIVVGLALSIISLFGKNVQLIQNNYSNSTRLNLFENQITLDFNQFHTIIYDPNDNSILLKTPLDSISYTFNENYIIRDLDTILNKKNTRTMYLLGDKIHEGRIDALKVELGEDKVSTFIFIYKENDANHYLGQYGN